MSLWTHSLVSFKHDQSIYEDGLVYADLHVSYSFHFLMNDFAGLGDVQ